MRQALLTASLIALAAPAAAQKALPITPEQARTLPPAEAAQLVFRDLAAQMQSMTRPERPRRSGKEEAVTELTFATAPRSLGDPGLCVATLVHAGLDLPPSHDRIGETGTVATQRVFKVVGDVDPRDPWGEAEIAAQERLCARAGPVVPPEADDEGRAYFFTLSGHPLPSAGVIALQQAIRSARAGSYGEIVCDDPGDGERPSRCADPRKLLGGLELANLTEVAITPPAQGGKVVQIKANFAVSEQAFWRLTLDVEFTTAADGARIFRPVRTKLSAGRIFTVDESIG